MTAQVSRDDAGRYWVTCTDHDWRWEAKGGADHAANLAAKHDRENHPGAAGPTVLHLSRAADYLLICHADLADTNDDARRAYFAAMDMWRALTGLSDEAALAYARTIRTNGFTAVIPPF